MHNLLRIAWRWLWGAVALILVSAAVLLTLARLALPFASDYRAELEQHLSSYLDVPLTIGRLDVEWHGLGPRLRVENLRITGPPGYPSARVERAYLDLDLTLPTGEDDLPLRIRGVSLIGLDAQVSLDAQGRPAESGVTVGGARRPLPEIVGRFLAVERLHLRQARIRIEQPGREPIVLREAEIRVLNEDGRHRIAASARPPATHGQRIEAALDLRGEIGAPERWRATGYLRGTDVVLAAWPRPWRRVAGLALRGRGDLEAWGHWSAGGVQRLQAEADLHEIGLARGDGPAGGATVAFERLAGRFAWARTGGGWRIDAADVAVERGGRAWRADGFTLARVAGARAPEMAPEMARNVAEDTAATATPQWRGQIGHARIEDMLALAELLPLPPAVTSSLAPIIEREPHGALRDLRFHAAGRDDYALRATAEDLGWSPGGAIPGAAGLDGRLALDPGGGFIDLTTADARVRAPRLFRSALPITDLRGRIDVTRGPEGWRLRAPRLRVANADLEAAARVDLRLPAGAPARIDLQVDFAQGDVAAVSRYLPVGIMKPKLVGWLDHALVGGRVVDGRLLWRGPIADFPHAEPGNVFEVTMEVADARLDYAPKWPGRLEGAGRVRFRGRSMAVELDRGRLFDTEIAALSARIDDFADPVLELRGRAHGPLSDLIHVVNESPLRRRLGAFLAGAHGTGDAALDLALTVPLRQLEHTHARGRVRLQGNGLEQPRFGLVLADLTGAVRFGDGGVSIAGLAARLGGQPVRIDARTRPGPERTLLVGVQGELGTEALLPGLPPALAERIEGRAPWHVQLQVPAGEGDGSQGMRLRASSTLVGTAIELPAPLGKPAEARRALHFEVPIAADGSLGRGQLRYGGRLQAALELAGRRGALALKRGIIQLGPGSVSTGSASTGSMPTESGPAAAEQPAGIQLHGRVAELDLGAWADLLTGDAGRAEHADAGAAAAPDIGEVDLRIGHARYRGYGIADLRLRASREAAAWRVRVDSDAVAGRASVPPGFGPGGPPLRLRLARLDWSALDAAEGAVDAGAASLEAVDPAALPPLDLRIERVELSSGTLRGVVLRTTPRPDGLLIRQIAVDDPDLRIEGKGRWVGGESPATSLRLELRSDDVGAASSILGHGGIVARADGRITADLRWPGTPWSPALPGLAGEVALRLRDGVLKPVDPGFARLLGLLDLKGLLQSGFQFDRLKGDVELDAGEASTRNLRVEGPVGRLRIRGRSDLVARRHDHTVAFRPELSRSLPLIGALSGGPATGVAVALVQGLLRNLGADMERAAEVTYTLTGPWDDPKVDRVSTDPNGPTRGSRPPAASQPNPGAGR